MTKERKDAAIAELPIVTFIAPSSDAAALPPDPTDLMVTPESHDAIRRIREQLEKLGAVETPIDKAHTSTRRHMLVTAKTIKRCVSPWLNAYLTADSKRKLRVQFVGHSVAGALGLGAALVPRDQWHYPPYYVIDSNPHALGVLSNYVDRIEDVMFAGCNVGQWVKTGHPVNGRTLMFTFAEMWHCRVRGANTTVNANDFTADWYPGREGNEPVGWFWNRDQHKVDRLEVKEPQIEMHEHALARPTSIKCRGADLTPEEVTAVVEQFNAVVDEVDQPSLATSELEFLFEAVEGETQIARLLCGGRFLAFGHGSHLKVYANAASRTSVAFRTLISKYRELQSEQLYESYCAKLRRNASDAKELG